MVQSVLRNRAQAGRGEGVAEGDLRHHGLAPDSKRAVRECDGLGEHAEGRSEPRRGASVANNRKDTMKLTTALLALLLAIPAPAQQKPASTIPPTPPTAAAKHATPPVIPDALRAQFFKAQSQMIQANAQAQQRQSEFQSSVANSRRPAATSTLCS